MPFEIDASARREALAIRHGDMDESVVRLGRLAANMASSEMVYPQKLTETAVRFKARTFGHAGIVVADAVEMVLEEYEQYGEFGLLRRTEDGVREATEEDIAGMSAFTTSWIQTLSYAAQQVLENPKDDRRKANIEALSGHWELRRRVHKNINYGIQELLETGIGTGTVQCYLAACGLNKFCIGRQSEPEQTLATIRRSYSPINSMASLTNAQLHAFNIKYSGKRQDERKDPYPLYYLNKLNPNIYTLSAQGLIVVNGPIENLQLDNYEDIGSVPSGTHGPRIGCPILLTPKLLQRFWTRYVNSLTTAMQII